MVLRPKTIIATVTVSAAVLALIILPRSAGAHRSGCHNLHTCPSDTNSYVCGDLGYPCDGSTSVKDIAPAAINIPLIVEKAFREQFGRLPSEVESAFWKQRFRRDKDGVYKIRRAMAWHKSTNSFGPRAAAVSSTTGVTVSQINQLFRDVYDGRTPTVSENRYWRSRLTDKSTTAALTGAMAFHKARGIQH